MRGGEDEGSARRGGVDEGSTATPFDIAPHSRTESAKQGEGFGLARSERALSLRLGPLASVLVAVANQSDRTPRSPSAVDEGANVNIVL